MDILGARAYANNFMCINWFNLPNNTKKLVTGGSHFVHKEMEAQRS